MGNIRNKKLGGEDWTNEAPTYQDLNTTFDETIKSAIVGQAQIPFSILKSAGAFTNEGNLCADRTTDANGANNTINTGSSTALYNTTTDLYYLDSIAGTDILDVDTVSVSGTTTKTLVKTLSSVNKALSGHSYEIWGKHYGGGSAGHDYIIYTKFIFIDATTYETSQTFTFQTTDDETWTVGSITNLYPERKVSSVEIYLELDYSNAPEEMRTKNNNLEVIDFNLSDTVIADIGTLTLTGDETFISVYNSATIPANTTIKCQLSDETKTISADTTLTANVTTLIPITTTPTADDVLKLTFTLETTDTSLTPSWYGYGCYRYKGD